MGNCLYHQAAKTGKDSRAKFKAPMSGSLSGSVRAARRAMNESKRLASRVTGGILENSVVLDHTDTGRDVYDYYDVVDQIGVGTTCHVFIVREKIKKKKKKNASEATSQEAGQLYALKKIHKNWVEDDFLEEVRNEVNILRTLHHPNIVRVYDVFESETEIYIVMEYCSGGDLSSRTPYKEEESSKIMSNLLSAVAFLHNAGFVHRDIKLENCIFESSHPDAEIKLIDFGFAKAYGKKRHTMEQVVGTVYTISPQVLQGKYSEKADEWSCGVIAYILLCNRKPFDGQFGAEVAKKIEKGFFYEGPEFKALSGAAKAFIRSLLTYDEDERYSASRALRSAWLAKYPRDQGRPEKEVLDQVTCSLMQSADDGRFKTLVMQLIAYNSTREETETLRKAFDYFDRNNDGLISYWEWQHALRHYDYSNGDVEAMFASIDIYRKGAINYTEFVAATLEAGGPIDDDRILAAFKRLDTKDLGYISKETLLSILGDDCDEHYDAIVSKLIEEVDRSGDGKVSVEEFLALFRDR
eukprot:CAMPEP_0178645634 /NCGR_PEP_ID=MMETSP0698-20121128/18934_1 /TAXON_ID=265572 /ORGANISM="Extubocellulus spinifer, Strain CCMP396" /LENGTH=524 /DNA_ID=CAMNT_0020286713 /DNA_START=428 /DNA_END=2002 /DNA_ORIENTATION=-